MADSQDDERLGLTRRSRRGGSGACTERQGGRSKGPKDDLEVASRDRLEEEWPWGRIWGRPVMSEQSGYVEVLSTVSGRSPDQIRQI
jgi:hypothetical protein